MSIFRRGKVYWYEFVFKGERFRESTHQRNRRAAADIESAHRTALAKGEAGIFEKKKVPTLAEFKESMVAHWGVKHSAKPRTSAFYKEKLDRLLEFTPLASSPLDQIDEHLIERYVQYRRKNVKPGTVNRQLATLSVVLTAARKWKVIDRLPLIERLAGEGQREFVLSWDQEPIYLDAAPQPLKDLALLILDSGLRIGEALQLRRCDVWLKPAHGAKLGYMHIPGGKTRYAKRNLSLTKRVREMLQRRLRENTSALVFPNHKGSLYEVTYLDRLQQVVREKLKWSSEFVIHSLRHTMLTRLGESGASAFTVMRVAGHSSITVSQRYVHPSPESLERAFERFETMQISKALEIEEPPSEGVPTDSTTVPVEEAA
jgi:integrase